MKIVVALGGNALTTGSGKVTLSGLKKNIKKAVKSLVLLARQKHGLAVVFGSGPQVGALLLQNELSKKHVSAMPLDVLDAQVQGQLGYLLEQALLNALSSSRIKRAVVSILSEVVVNPADSAFTHPSKPIGPFYSKKQAMALKAKGLDIIEDAGRGFRRVVASPRPLKVVEAKTINRLLDSGTVIIAVGGGGIPVIKQKNALSGVEAVIDKDLAAASLAVSVKADRLIILTTVDNAFLFYRTKKQKAIKKISVKEAKKFLKEGHFEAGSMKPKIAAAILFAQKTGKKAIITSPKKLALALKGKAGTIVSK